MLIDIVLIMALIVLAPMALSTILVALFVLSAIVAGIFAVIKDWIDFGAR